MTVIRPNSVSGITSITAQANEINFFRSNGALAGLQLNGVNFNTTTGVSTFNNLNVGGVLTYQDVTNVDSIGIITARSTIDAQGDVSIADKIIHTGDTNTAIRFPANDTFAVETNGAERLRITSTGVIQFSGTNNADNTNKLVYLTTPSYDTNEEPFGFIHSGTYNNQNLLYLGGGMTSSYNACTLMKFYTTNSINTQVGTERLCIESWGGIQNNQGAIYGGGAANEPKVHFNGAAPSNDAARGHLAVSDSAAFNASPIARISLVTRYNSAGGYTYMGGIEGGKENSTDGEYGGFVRIVTRPHGSGNQERLRITSGGQVNIGGDYTQTSYATQITGDLLVQKTASAYLNPNIDIYNYVNGGYAGSITFSGKIGGSKYSQARIRAYGGSNSSDGALAIETGNMGEKLRITSAGQLLVGTTSSTAAPGGGTGYSNMCTFNFPGITLTHYGVVAGFTYGALTFTNSQYFVSNGTTGVYLGNGSTSWTAHSDERLKTNITELDGTKAYNHIKTARATSFNWNATGYPTDTKIGFIAQDWETNYPEVVNSTSETVDGVENPKGIQYTETVPVLMAALKKAISKIETLEAEVAALKSS